MYQGECGPDGRRFVVLNCHQTIGEICHQLSTYVWCRAHASMCSGRYVTAVTGIGSYMDIGLYTKEIYPTSTEAESRFCHAKIPRQVSVHLVYVIQCELLFFVNWVEVNIIAAGERYTSVREYAAAAQMLPNNIHVFSCTIISKQPHYNDIQMSQTNNAAEFVSDRCRSVIKFVSVGTIVFGKTVSLLALYILVYL